MFAESNEKKEESKPFEPEPVGQAPPDELPALSFDEIPDTVPEPKKEEHNIVPSSNDIPVLEEPGFDDAINDIYSSQPYQEQEEQQEPQNAESLMQDLQEPSVPEGQVSSPTNSAGFFSEFQRFIDGNDIPNIADDLVSKDFLEKMKEYHFHRQEGKPYYFHSDDAKKELNMKLTELRNLERGWFMHRERIAKEEVMLSEKEEQIADKVDQLKYLLKQIKTKEEFNRQAQSNNFFRLSNGHVLKSLSDLSASLRVMNDETFSSHVTASRNDFASWIKDSLSNHSVSEEVAKYSDREGMLKCLAELEKA